MESKLLETGNSLAGETVKKVVANTAEVKQGQLAEVPLKQQLAADPGNRAVAAQIQQIEDRNNQLARETDTAAQTYPDYSPLQSAAANFALTRGDMKKAQRYADQAVAAASTDKEWTDAMNLRANVSYKTGDYAKASADAAAVLKKFPGDKAAMDLYQQTKGRGGASTAATAVAAAPAPAGAERAVPKYVSPVSQGDAAKVRSYLDLAQNRMQLRDPQAALEAARQASKLDPANGDAFMAQALAWAAIRDMAQALAAVTKAIEKWTEQHDNRAGDAYALRAKYNNQVKDPNGALMDATAAIGLNPKDGNAYFQRAAAENALGRKQDALSDLQRAAEYDPARYRQAYADAAAGETAAAAPAKSAAPAGGLFSSAAGWLNAGAAAAGAALLVLAGAVVWMTRKGSPVGRITWGRSAAADAARDLDGQYSITEQIGEGGMGAVFKGWDRSLKRTVAVKRLRAELQGNARERDRFIREAELVASLRHPNIVEIYAIVRAEGDTYLVFEYVVGKTVHDLLNDSPGRHFAPKRALEILRQIADAVDLAHSRRVIHRDLKPVNVMVADGGWVKVMDFGIARQVQDSMLTTTNTIVGTPTYMAPEQAMGGVVKESDVYSLGVTLFEMLTGGLPFKGPDEMRDKLDGRFVAPSALVPDLPPAVDAVIAKALSARAEQRYHSCRELYNAAAEALDGRSTPVRS